MKFKLELPGVYDYQETAIFGPERYSCIEGSTKVGKTYPCILWLLNECGTRGGLDRHFWWVAPVFLQADIAYRRTKALLSKADPDKEIWSSNETKLTVTLKGRGTIWFKTGDDPDNLYGEDVFGVVIDEASRVKEPSWWAIRSTITATEGRVRAIGNVKGRKNWFFRLCQGAKNGTDPNTTYHKLTADHAISAGIMTPEELADAKSKLPDAVFQELYYAVPSDDGGNPFGLKAISECVQPMSEDMPVAWGFDLAKSRDFSVGIGLDQAGIVSAFERWQGPWGITKPKILGMVGNDPATIDSTGVGDPIVEEMQGEAPAIEGFKFTSQSKQQLMEGLASAIQRRAIGFPDGPIRDELEAFEYEYTRTGVRYSAPEGLHDDCVCALALAWHCMSHAVPFEMVTVRNPLRKAAIADIRAVSGDLSADFVRQRSAWESS